jgi:hypothetical protein
LSTSESPDRTKRWIALAAVALPILILFGPALFSDRLFAMRDAGHYYYPLFKWCADEWSAGRVPLWNPLENCGTAIHADPTASLWYPGKLVFTLPLDFSICFKLYIVSHVVLAAIASYWLARKWGASIYGSALAALSYSCGGSVVFQHCNVVYLVGAAWLPVAVGLVDDIFRERRFSSAIWLAVVLALIVLGGDPQMAYHVLLIAAVYAVVLAVRRKSEDMDHRLMRRQTILSGGLIALGVTIALCLAAIQVLPSAQATRDSERAFSYVPRNLYEASTHLFEPRIADEFSRRLRDVRDGLTGPPIEGSHHSAAYDFSVGPWRLAELVWPNVGGRMYPTHRRWFSLWSEESRIWSPTLYLGLLPMALGLTAYSFRSGNARVRWLSWVALLFLLGSFGTFGLGWIARQIYEFRGNQSSEFPIGDGVGGIYWLLVVLLPKYVLFRYPAKLLIVTSLALSQLAATGWDRVLAEPPRRLIYVLTGLGATSLVAGVAAAAMSRFVALGAGAVDPVFGPFDSHGAWTDILSSLIHASVVALGATWALRTSTQHPRLVPAALLALCSIELAVANYWLAPTAPARLWREPSRFAAPVRNSNNLARVWRAKNWWPQHFAQTMSARRLEEIVLWERDTLSGRYGSLDRISRVNAQVGVPAADYRELLRQFVAPYENDRPKQELGLASTAFLLVPNVVDAQFAERVTLPDDAVLRRMLVTQPRVFVPSNIELIAGWSPGNRLTCVRMKDWREERDGVGWRAQVEYFFAEDLVRQRTSEDRSPRAAVIHDEPQRVVVQATLFQPGLVVLNDRYSPDWQAVVTSRTAAGESLSEPRVNLTNCLFRSVYLPPGEHTIEFRYQPRAFYWGAWISGLSWGVLLVVGLWLWRRSLRGPVPSRHERTTPEGTTRSNSSAPV